MATATTTNANAINSKTTAANKSPASSPAREIDPIDRYSALIVRGTIIGTGALGLAMFLRNARMFARFQHVKQIPEDYYRLGLHMKGVVRELTPSGWLRVEHRPDVKLPRLFTFRRKPKVQGYLNLRLAGLEVSPVGVEHMAKELKLVGRPVVFSVLKQVDREPDASDAEVNAKKPLRSVNLNMELVRKGYARVYGPDHPDHKKALQSNTNYSRLITKLLTCEQLAERRGLGLWERSTWVERVASYPDTLAQIIRHSALTKALLLGFCLLRDLGLALYSLGQHLFHTALVLGGYSAQAYRRFGQLVDRLSKWYFAGRGRGTGSTAGQGGQGQGKTTALPGQK